MDADGQVILRNDTAGAFRPDAEKRVRGAVEVAAELVRARSQVKSAEEGSEEQKAAKASLLILEAIMELSKPSQEELDRAERQKEHDAGIGAEQAELEHHQIDRDHQQHVSCAFLTP